MMHFHFIGIGGSGLSAIALVLLERGHQVSGSDRQLSPLALAVQDAGAQVHLGHHPENVQNADLVIRSSAIPDENPEVQAALANGIPVLKRADFMDRLMEDQQVIAVAGTHGKTTTTAMIAWMLTALSKDPSYIIGGVSANLGRNAHAGQGEDFVIEADEYDHMFLGLRPDIAVVTNVEHDHPDCYPTDKDFVQAFDAFVGCIQSEGVLVACCDDPGAARLLDLAVDVNYRTVSYAIDQEACDYRAQGLMPKPGSGFVFELYQRKNQTTIPVSLKVPGKHNVYNSLAALAVADQLGLDLHEASAALEAFQGTGRRFDVRGEYAGVIVVDDYAHHPTEIRATLSAARSHYPDRQIWAVWQPHTYSRTRSLLGEFITAFNEANHVIVTDVYAARENQPQDGFSARQVAAALAETTADTSKQAIYAPGLAQAGDMLLQVVKPGDLVLVLSAGDANQIVDRLIEGLSIHDFKLAGTDT